MSTKNSDSVFSFEIANGPSRDAIFDAIKYAYDDEAKIPLEFLLAHGYTMPQGSPGQAIVPVKTKAWRLTSVQHEDGSGVSFNIEGYCKANLRLSTPERAIGYLAYRFKAYYNCRSRNGMIELTEC